ncbi:FAD-dependent oxidoreductase [Pseudoduganella sp. SL102]|uniref:FAD-dependent oxidoreductase n=1 Tax=Pseudoduganella sp. SL102 TaxID=2995154 RepID=UPI00248B37B3|nr:FAD-dependent oxidoreductase [Pseudoduganella sp. SL102]WBS04943.1 FAD-dependent oxidoreductase [Pseudoduganella sp. SL102]
MANQQTHSPQFLPEGSRDEQVPAVAASIEQRRHQIFPVLAEHEVQRLLRFGTVRHYADGVRILEAGFTPFGMVLVLAGRMASHRYDGLGNSALVKEHGPGEFTAEVSQLAGRPSLVNVTAVGPVEALVIPADQLRALVIAEAELGERIVRALILRRVNLIESGSGGPVLVGPPGHPNVFHLQSFLTANGHPHTVLEPDGEEDARALCEHYRPTAGDWPLVVCPDGSVLMNPSFADMGRCLGMLPELPADKVWDVIVVGAGPAGLATAVYAGSEGLSVLALEQRAFGGQAAASARIENYLGFPTGISGGALAGRAYVQAMKFGVEVVIPMAARHLACDASPLALELADGRRVLGRTVVLSCGARYRRPSLANIKQFEGRGIYYWASRIEANLCAGAEVILVGGGNSAGQAAVFLSAHAARVHMLVRGDGLKATMSTYLIERIRATPNIELHPHTEIVALEGDDEGLQAVRWRNHRTLGESECKVCRVFLFIGAEPNTDWLGDCGVEVDAQGFIRTGDAVTAPAEGGAGSTRSTLETSVPGVFAIGDVRSGSTKRVAAGVGEGAQVVAQIHAYLAMER